MGVRSLLVYLADEEDVVSADEGAEGSEDEDEAEDAGAADVMEDMDVEISETEGEQEPTATNRLQACHALEMTTS